MDRLKLVVTLFFVLSAIEASADLSSPKTPTSATEQLNMANAIRLERQILEAKTQEELLLRLERARLQDEHARRERLFQQAYQAEYTQQPTTEPVAQETIPAPTPVAVNTEKTALPVEESTTDEYYLGVLAGAVNYPTVANVSAASPAAGVVLGVNLPPFLDFIGLGTTNLWVETGFLYSFQQTEIDRATSVTNEDVDQMGLYGNLNYHWKFSDTQWIIPTSGVVFSYSHRRYNAGENSSNAFDVGAQVGADFALTKTFLLGVEYRYMHNLDYEKQMGAANTDVALQTLATGLKVHNLESFDYQMVLLNAKFTF